MDTQEAKGMKSARTLFFIVLTAVLVAGGIMVAIYLLRGGEGDSTDIPTNPDAAASLTDPRSTAGDRA